MVANVKYGRGVSNVDDAFWLLVDQHGGRIKWILQGGPKLVAFEGDRVEHDILYVALCIEHDLACPSSSFFEGVRV